MNVKILIEFFRVNSDIFIRTFCIIGVFPHLLGARSGGIHLVLVPGVHKELPSHPGLLRVPGVSRSGQAASRVAQHSGSRVICCASHVGRAPGRVCGSG